MNETAFVDRLLHWYGHNQRDLPWRHTKDPYIIWLSEVILQQTRVSQGLPYFNRFLSQYPNLRAFAEAPLDDILRVWQGLGYYSRARNMHACAQQVMRIHQGEFPQKASDLIKLKGIGPYTAAAIASFSSGEAVAVVDGNVFRVLSRCFGIVADINSHQGKKVFQELANNLVPKTNAGDYNQAIMEFGALQCVPSGPDCSICPIKDACFAHKNELVSELPVKVKKTKIRVRYFIYGHITCNGLVVMAKRGKGDIWQGLYDFPMVEASQKPEKQWIEQQVFVELGEFRTVAVEDSPHWYKHILTHQRIFATFVRFELPSDRLPLLSEWAAQHDLALIPEGDLESIGKPRLLLKYLNGEK